MESMTNGLDQEEERISRTEDKVKELLNSGVNKEKAKAIMTILQTSETQLRHQIYKSVVQKREPKYKLKAQKTNEIIAENSQIKKK
jgi:hypothetical protein